MLVLLLFTAFFLAYANGANDNFKGVATLYGSCTVNYKTAIAIATLATFAGSICAIFLAQGLVASFSGKGLIPQNIAGTRDFLIAVGLGAASTVLLATRLGFPISTTHSLVGALVGTGLIIVGADVNFDQLTNTFLIPLLVSPFIAVALGAVLYWLFSYLRKKFRFTKETCVCIGEKKEFVPVTTINNAIHSGQTHDIALTIAEKTQCMDLYTNRIWGISSQKLLDIGHTISGMSVCFARGLNDTPKIAGLLVAANALDIRWGMVAIAISMAIGGLLNARRVAETMSHKITQLNRGQGFSANLVTSILVIFASKLGVPVSTTHVSVGSIFGISIISDNRDTRMIRNIILSWVITLPTAAILSASIYYLLS